MGKIILRDYQKKASDVAIEKLLKGENCLIGACVGAGKSLIVADVMRRLKRANKKSLCCISSATLVYQNAQKYHDITGERGAIYCASLNSRELSDVTFSTIQSASSRNAPIIFRNFGFDYLIVDEAHNISADSGQFSKMINILKPSAILGLTGTPWRMGSGRIYGHGEKKIFKKLDLFVTISELQKRGYLVPLEVKDTIHFSNEEIGIDRTGDYDISEIEMVYSKQIDTIFSDLYQRLGEFSRAFAFCPSIKFSQMCAEKMRIMDISCAHIDGGTPQKERKKILDQLKNKEIKIIFSVETMTTGVDCPPVDAIISLRPTTSSGLVIQMVGRGLRLSPDTGKTQCLLYDYAGWGARFGDLCKINPPLYSLKEAEKEKKKFKLCKKCYNESPLSARACDSCGNDFDTSPRVVEYNSKKFCVENFLERKAKAKSGRYMNILELYGAFEHFDPHKLVSFPGKKEKITIFSPIPGQENDGKIEIFLREKHDFFLKNTARMKEDFERSGKAFIFLKEKKGEKRSFYDFF